MCDRYPNAKKGSEEAYKQELARWISKASLEYQTFIDSEMADLNKGTGLGENGKRYIDRLGMQQTNLA